MSEETLYKAEEARVMKQSAPSSLPAIGLIGFGGTLLVLNLMGVHMMEIFWPLFVVGPGLLLLWPAYASTAERQRVLAFLAVPGAMLLAVGALLFVMNITGHFEAWAYSWTLVLAAAAMGLQYLKRHDATARIHRNGRGFIRNMGMLFLGLAAFFEIIVFESVMPWLPLALIAFGVYTLMKNRRAALA
ncbi:MAG: hypothetical protein KC425_19915 [Anaerolineales bacterium]|nr:hypothetical protein [Anaerolineales bacterium]